MFRPLNPLLHSQLRLAVMSILMSVAEADFVYLKEKTASTAGNLSVQLDKLLMSMPGGTNGQPFASPPGGRKPSRNMWRPSRIISGLARRERKSTFCYTKK